MKAIDVHTHAFPDFLAEKAISTLARNAYKKPYHNGTIKGLLKEMDRAKVEKSCVLSIATKPEQAENILNWAIEIKSNRIIPFISIHPLTRNYKEILEKAKDNGIIGVKLHPHYQGFFIDDEKLFSFYETILKQGFIIEFHSGVDDGFPGKDNASAIRVKKVIDEFNGSKIILAHYGAYKEWKEVYNLLAGMDVYFETSFAIKVGGIKLFKRILNKHSHKRILFGTDSPWNSIYEEKKLLEINMEDKEVLADILYNNALDLFGIGHINI